MHTHMTIAAHDALLGNAFRFSTEKELHDGIALALTAAGVAFEREVVAGPEDRFDFLLDCGIVIEVKIKGSMADALRQVHRYAKRDDVNAVVLATTRSFWTVDVDQLHGKPFYFIKLKSASF